MTFKNRRAMADDRMEPLMAYGEHLGLMMGGTWDKEKLRADFFPYAHPADCCDRVPSPGRVTQAIKTKLSRWLDERGIKHEWRSR
jgi:hypothetical protein